MSLNTPVCVITGGSSGIGLATASRFLDDGYRVVLCGRDSQRIAAASASLRVGEDRLTSLTLDIGDEGAGQQLIDHAVGIFGRLDVLVNNAGTAPLAAAHQMTPADFEATLATNIRGVFATTQAAWPHFRSQGGGAIVNISSLSATDPFPGLGVYGASKAWVELFTKVTAEEGREHKIRVFAVAPGAVDTPLLQSLFPDIPQDVRLSATEVAEIIFRLTDDAMVPASGQTIAVRK